MSLLPEGGTGIGVGPHCLASGIESYAQIPGCAQGLSKKALMKRPSSRDWQITGC